MPGPFWHSAQWTYRVSCEGRGQGLGGGGGFYNRQNTINISQHGEYMRGYLHTQKNIMAENCDSYYSDSCGGGGDIRQRGERV
jgi:hypothetical protein